MSVNSSLMTSVAGSETTPKIAILGAGPSGLLLARLLQQSPTFACQITIFELDPSRNARNQGGSLDLHPQQGQLALKEAGLWSQFLQHARPEGDVKKIVDGKGTVLFDENGMTKQVEADGIGERPEIDRDALRSILLDSVAPETVRWGSKVVAVSSTPASGEEKHDVVLADGTKETGFDLVIGADGAWSKVRPLLTDVKPYYSGITALEGWAEDTHVRHPWLSEYVGAGSCFMFDEGRAVLAQRQGNGDIRIYACVRKPEDWLERESGLEGLEEVAAATKLTDEQFADCGQNTKRVVLESTDKVIPRKLWMLPVGMQWGSRPGLTLLGDAAHLMTPFAGVGVNLALQDSLQLARLLIAHPSDPALAVRQYEQTMFVYSKKFAEKTYAGLQGHFSGDGAAHFAGRLKRGHEAMRMKLDPVV
ncbi:hypothetical protein LTR95_001450 [Oleoguttula sp. CCFEE 5521]